MSGISGRSEKLVAGGFVLALLVLGGVGWSSYVSVQRLITSRQWVEHTFEVLEALDKTSNGTTAAASGRYGYLMKREATDLEDYETGVRTTKQGIKSARQLTIDNPSQQSRLTELEVLLTKRFALLQRSIDLLQQGQSQPTIQTDLSNQGFLLSREIRTKLNLLKEEEKHLLELRKVAIDDSIRQAIVANGIGYLFGLSLLMGVFALLQRQIRIRKQTETALQKYAEEIYDLYNQSPCGYHSLDATGMFTRINDTELSWLGYSRDEVLHKLKFTDLTTAKSAQTFQETFPKFKQQGWVSDIEFEIVRKDGTVLPVSLSATAITDAAGNFAMSRSTLFDISDRKRVEVALQQANEQLEARVQERTAELSQVNALLRGELIDRKQAEQALLESEKQLRLITDGLPVLVSYVDSEQRFRFNNRTYEQWYGHTQAELKGQLLRQVIGESAYQGIKQHVKSALLGQAVTYESMMPYKDGGTRWIDATYIPDVGEQGEIRGFFALIADITGRKQTEEALRQSEERLYWVLQNMPVMLDAFDPDWNIIIWNRECERVTGYSADEIVGNPKCMELLYPSPDYRHQMVTAWAERGNNYRNWEWDIACKDGSVKTVSWSNISKQFPIPGWATWGIGVDVTDRKRAEAALRESEQRLSLAVEGSGMATWDIDLSTGKALWSAQHFKMLGYEPAPSGEATVDMWRNCAHPDDREWVSRAAERAIQERSVYRSEHRIIRVDNGQIVWLAAFGQALYNEAGQAVRFIGIILDISDRKHAEQALQKANEQLENKVQERTAALKQSNEDLVRSNQELEQFAYVASHDLQEPLRAITGYTQLLVQDYHDHFDDSAQQYADYIVDGAKRMQQLIQDLLHYSRVGTRDLMFTPTDCNVVLRQVLDSLQVAIADSHAIITHDPLPTVMADKIQLAQLFQNLIGNAIKFCRDEVPQVHVSVISGQKTEDRRQKTEDRSPGSQESTSTQNSKLATQNSSIPYTPHPTPHSPSDWLFSVRDNGIGIKPRYLERIFEIFKRLHTRVEFPGTGIGLAICKKIVDRHGGHIWAESEPGNGTTFNFTIPHYDPSNVELDRDSAG